VGGFVGQDVRQGFGRQDGRGQLDLPGSEGVAAQRSSEAGVDEDAEACHSRAVPENGQPTEQVRGALACGCGQVIRSLVGALDAYLSRAN
jgi:hypothetical protein